MVLAPVAAAKPALDGRGFAGLKPRHKFQTAHHRRAPPRSISNQISNRATACARGSFAWRAPPLVDLKLLELPGIGALNSAVECHLHTVEVIGSNPIAPTIPSKASANTGPLRPLGISAAGPHAVKRLQCESYSAHHFPNR